jgi:hypothetical protein
VYNSPFHKTIFSVLGGKYIPTRGDTRDLTRNSDKAQIITLYNGRLISRGKTVDRSLAQEWADNRNRDSILTKQGYWYVVETVDSEDI